jgi:hypothetical protein
MEWWDFGSSWCECVVLLLLLLLYFIKFMCATWLERMGCLFGVYRGGARMEFHYYVAAVLCSCCISHTYRLLSPSLSLLKSTCNILKWNKHTSKPIISFDPPIFNNNNAKTNNALCSTLLSSLQRHNMILASTNYASPYPNLTPPNHPRYASFPASSCHVSIKILVKLFTIKYRRRRIGIEIWVLSRY